MTQGERALKLLLDLDDIEICAGLEYANAAQPLILAYADEIRAEAAEKVAAKYTEEGLYGVSLQSIIDTITGKE